MREPANRSRLRDVSGLLGGYSPLRRAWRRYRSQWMWRLSRTGSRIAPFVAQHGAVVRRGPFEGMAYPQALIGHVNFLAAKIMGAYEIELAEIVRELAALPFARVVNVGAGEGYYAVGLARAIPEAIVYAFETDGGERKLCDELALANGVGDRVRVQGTCDLDALRETVMGSTLVICDCEGGERELLRPDLIPGLLEATLLVEMHPLIDADIPRFVTARFAATHVTRRLQSEPRDPADWPEVAGIDCGDAALLLSESGIVGESREARGRLNEWALMIPKAVRTARTT